MADAPNKNRSARHANKRSPHQQLIMEVKVVKEPKENTKDNPPKPEKPAEQPLPQERPPKRKNMAS